LQDVHDQLQCQHVSDNKSKCVHDILQGSWWRSGRAAKPEKADIKQQHYVNACARNITTFQVTETSHAWHQHLRIIQKTVSKGVTWCGAEHVALAHTAIMA